MGSELLGRPRVSARAARAPARRAPSSASRRGCPTAAIVSALAVAAAAVLIIADEVTGGSRVDPVVVFAASGAVVALAIRVLGLLRENGLAVAAARVVGRSRARPG